VHFILPLPMRINIPIGASDFTMFGKKRRIKRLLAVAACPVAVWQSSIASCGCQLTAISYQLWFPDSGSLTMWFSNSWFSDYRCNDWREVQTGQYAGVNDIRKERYSQDSSGESQNALSFFLKSPFPKGTRCFFRFKSVKGIGNQSGNMLIIHTPCIREFTLQSLFFPENHRIINKEKENDGADKKNGPSHSQAKTNGHNHAAKVERISGVAIGSAGA